MDNGWMSPAKAGDWDGGIGFPFRVSWHWEVGVIRAIAQEVLVD
jgi:hypothetical protein